MHRHEWVSALTIRGWTGKRFHIAPLEALDDFPIPWMWSEKDDILNKLGLPRLAKKLSTSPKKNQRPKDPRKQGCELPKLGNINKIQIEQKVKAVFNVLQR